MVTVVARPEVPGHCVADGDIVVVAPGAVASRNHSTSDPRWRTYCSEVRRWKRRIIHHCPAQ